MELQRNCYTCGNSDHLSTNCPLNPSSGFKNKKRKTSSSSSSNNAPIISTPKFPPTYCPCGGDFCEIKLNPKNGELFHTCPNSNEMHCGYFKYCKKLKIGERLKQPQLPYPCCSCGAGICRLETDNTKGPDNGRKYFACRIPKGHGTCNFWQWQEDHYRAIRTAYEETISGDIEIHPSPFSSPTSPLDKDALSSADHHAVVVRWY